MAWSTPRTWVAEEVITAEIMNVHVRDQFTFLGTHGHSSNSGDGGDDLGGIDEIIFADATADPAAIGEMQRNGSALKYHDGTGVMFIGRDAAAGTPSLRTLGAGGLQAADGTHQHTLAGEFDEGTGEIIGGISIVGGDPGHSTATATGNGTGIISTQTISPTTTACVVWFAAGKASASGSTFGDLRWDVTLDGTGTLQTVDATGNGWNLFSARSPSGTILPAGSYTFRLIYSNKNAGSRQVNYQSASLSVFAIGGTYA